MAAADTGGVGVTVRHPPAELCEDDPAALDDLHERLAKDLFAAPPPRDVGHIHQVIPRADRPVDQFQGLLLGGALPKLPGP